MHIQKRIVALAGVIVVLIGVGGIIWWKQSYKKKTITSETTEYTEVSPTSIPIARKLWDDQSGFTLTYPETFTLDPHDEDQGNYAHLEFHSPTFPGSSIVWAKDTEYATIADWAKNDDSISGFPSIDTTLGGQVAKKIIQKGTQTTIITATIYDGLLFILETITNEDHVNEWMAEHEALVGSFVFKPIEGQKTQESTEVYEDYAVDEEELVE